MVGLKKSYRNVILREIRQSISRFLAIFFIVALGVGFFAGLMATTPDMRLSADQYFDETHTMDLRVISTLGLTDDDVEEIKKIDGVSGVMPAYSVDALMSIDSDDSMVARIHSLPVGRLNQDNPDYLNRLVVTQGRLPDGPGECVLEEQKMGNNPVEIGKTIRLSPENKDLSDTLSTTQFTVVGYVKSAYYMSVEREQSTVGNGKINAVLYTDEKSFSSVAYTHLFVTMTEAKEKTAFSTEYQNCVAPLKDQLKDLGTIRAVSRYEEVKSEAENKLKDAKTELQEKKEQSEQQLNEAKQQLDEGTQQILQSEQEILEGDKKLTEGQRTIEEKENQLKDAQRQIKDAQRTIEEQEKELNRGEVRWKQGKETFLQKEAELSDALAQLTAGEKELAAQETLLQQGEKKWSAGKKQLDAQKRQLEEAKQQLDQAKGIIEQTRQEVERLYALGLVDQAKDLEVQVAQQQAAFETGFAEYNKNLILWNQGQQQLQTQRESLDQGAAKLQTAKQQLELSKAQLDEGSRQLSAARDELQQSRSQLDEGKKQLNEGKRQLSLSIAQMNEGNRQLQEAKKQLDTSRAELLSGKKQLENAKQKLAEGELDYQNGKQEAQDKLSQAQEQLEEAEAQIRDLKIPEWYVLDRDTNLSYASFDSNAEKVEAIAQVFPVFFFLVAALVALTTMTRMIEEERTQIGTLKALGYGKGSIAFKYVIYAGSATIAGSLFGLAVGFQVFPIVIWGAYEILYNLPPLITVFNVKYALISSLAALFCTMLATFSACYSTLKETPARLMLPRAPKAGKRILLEYITPIWSHMKFTHKVTSRNLIRYKKRFFMTVIGIAGCTALLLTGFGLRDSISDIVEKQFNDLYQYNLIISVKDSEDRNTDPSIRKILTDNAKVSDSLAVSQETADVTSESGKTQNSVYLYVPESSQRLTEFIKMRDRKSGDPISFTDGAVLVSEKMAGSLGIKTGSTITVQNADGITAECTVGGIVENYVYAYVYMSPDLYRGSFASEPDFTQIIAKVEDTSLENRDMISTALLESDKVNAAQFTNDLSESFSDIVKNIDYIVMVLILCAGLLAFIVLYNLTNINITERQKEIATIKVLGFFDREVSAYIYRETAVLSLIGTGVGLLLGIVLHSFVVKTSEVDMVMFGRSIRPLSFALAALLTLIFSLLVNLVMYKKLKKISMVESMKSGE